MMGEEYQECKTVREMLEKESGMAERGQIMIVRQDYGKSKSIFSVHRGQKE